MKKISPYVNEFNNLLLDTEKNGTLHEIVMHILTNYLKSSYCTFGGYSHIKGKVCNYRIAYEHSIDCIPDWPFPLHKGDAKRQYIYAYVTDENGIINEYHLSSRNVKKYLRYTGKNL